MLSAGRGPSDAEAVLSHVELRVHVGVGAEVPKVGVVANAAPRALAALHDGGVQHQLAEQHVAAGLAAEVVTGVVDVGGLVKRQQLLLRGGVLAEVHDVQRDVVLLEQLADGDVVGAVLPDRTCDEADDALLLRLVETVLERQLGGLEALDDLALAVGLDQLQPGEKGAEVVGGGHDDPRAAAGEADDADGVLEVLR
ncbi:HBS1-like protein [Babesia caballi]|uniref:HBS1-like protein n=1 Tax=Babesia caballi TaxID=5871 RepID=A0AAV4LXS6_BABCB|nr:HBS1-like protein [Babesia caballi]